MQDERQDPGTDPRGDPKVNALEDHLNVINVIQQGAVIITGREVKVGRPEPDESDSDRWL